jgi:hypothetical protein
MGAGKSYDVSFVCDSCVWNSIVISNVNVLSAFANWIWMEVACSIVRFGSGLLSIFVSSKRQFSLSFIKLNRIFEK